MHDVLYAVVCPLLTTPYNGMLRVPSYEDTCSFTCNTVYELTGSNLSEYCTVLHEPLMLFHLPFQITCKVFGHMITNWQKGTDRKALLCAKL